MTVTLNIPDALAASLGGEAEEVQRAIAESAAIESYRSGKFSAAWSRWAAPSNQP